MEGYQEAMVLVWWFFFFFILLLPCHWEAAGETYLRPCRRVIFDMVAAPVHSLAKNKQLALHDAQSLSLLSSGELRLHKGSQLPVSGCRQAEGGGMLA
jgi:hypothetical protein